MIYPDRIPLEMRQYDQWVNWRYEDRGDDKPTKVPYCSRDMTLASVSRTDTWSSFDQAVNGLNDSDGIGFMLSLADPYTIVDFDDTVDPAIVQKMESMEADLNSYSEISPSGKGLHIVVKAVLDRGRRRGPFEFYSHKRFMTMTGHIYRAESIKPAQAKLHEYMTKLGLDRDVFVSNAVSQPEIESDREVYDRAASATNGQKFLGLWNGQFDQWYDGDQSRADFALMDILGFYSQNHEQLARMFRMSGLGRRKKAKRDDYVNTMIHRAMDNQIPHLDFGVLRSQLDEKANNPVLNANVQPKINGTHIAESERSVGNLVHDGAMSVPPGRVGELAQTFYAQSIMPVKEIAIISALGFFSGVAGRAWNTHTGTGLNLYLMLIAGSGKGKEQIGVNLDRITDHLQQTFIAPNVNDYIGPGNPGSGQGMLRVFDNHPTNSIVSVWDEFGRTLSRITSPKANGADSMIKDFLLKFFNKSGFGQSVKPTVYSDAERNTKTIHSPAFTLIGESVPRVFYKSLDEHTISSGLLPRFLVIEYKGKRVNLNRAGASVPFDDGLLRHIGSVVGQATSIIHSQTVAYVGFADGVEKAWSDHAQEITDYMNSQEDHPANDIWNRTAMHTLRIGGILAVADNPFQPIMTMEHFLWAKNFAIYSAQHLQSSFAEGAFEAVGNSLEELRHQTVFEACKEYLTDGPVKNHPTFNPLMHADNVIPLAWLRSHTMRRKAFKDQPEPGRNIKAALKSLEELGYLVPMPKSQVRQKYRYAGDAYALLFTGNGSRIDL